MQVYLLGDRLCYCQADSSATNAAGSSKTVQSLQDPGHAAAGAANSAVWHSAVNSKSINATTSSSLLDLASGSVHYIALDRIPVRPLPIRPLEHTLDPMQRSYHPDIGVAIMDAR